MVTTTRQLPHWDMTVVYPGLDSPEFKQGFEAAGEAIDDLGQLFDRHEIAAREPAPLDDATVRAFEEVVARYNSVLEETHTVGAYIRSFVATNSRDTVAQAWLSENQQQSLKLSQLGTRFTAW